MNELPGINRRGEGHQFNTENDMTDEKQKLQGALSRIEDALREAIHVHNYHGEAFEEQEKALDLIRQIRDLIDKDDLRYWLGEIVMRGDEIRCPPTVARAAAILSLITEEQQ